MGGGEKGERGSRADCCEDGQFVLGANLFLACEIVSSAADDTVGWDAVSTPNSSLGAQTHVGHYWMELAGQDCFEINSQSKATRSDA
jgi:hypothetical protein